MFTIFFTSVKDKVSVALLWKGEATHHTEYLAGIESAGMS